MSNLVFLSYLQFILLAELIFPFLCFYEHVRIENFSLVVTLVVYSITTLYIQGLSLLYYLCFRWRWNPMFLMTRCVTSVRELDAEGSSHHSSVPMWPACSIIVNIAGHRFTLDLAGSSTNPWWRRGLTDRELSHSDGAKHGTRWMSFPQSWLY